MHDRRRGRIVRVVLLTLAVGGVLPALAFAQQAGHGSVPTTGAAAPGGFPAAEREPDPVLARIDELRRALADLAKQYKKTKDEARTESRTDLLAALGRAQAEVGGARERLSGKTD
jgi:hypothetical protein